MSTKILIIGQAPPAKQQTIPYDSTMLYDWFQECGISKEQAQQMFEFEAVYNKFPGHASTGGHLKPTQEQMDAHWDETLEEKIQIADKIILLGNVAKNYFWSKPKTWSCNLQVLEIMHPSKLNYNLYRKNKDAVINKFKKFLE